MRDFRNYDRVTCHFSPGTNLILGRNGTGKSNLLEAIYILSTSKSFRNAQDQKITKWEKDGYFIRGVFSSENGEYDISIEFSGENKVLSINGVQEKRISNIIGYVYCVLCFFEDVYLIIGPPGMRRNFLDLILSMEDHLYFRNLKVYLNVLRQKNKYLKDSATIDNELLFSWNEQLISLGFYLIKKRVMLIDFINSYIEASIKELGKELIFPFRIIYKSNIPGVAVQKENSSIEDAYREALKDGAMREVKFQTAIFGPHRDDFQFTEGEYEVRHFGSIGEARLSSIILKLAQAEYYRKIKNITPILLIDDILLELDMNNMERALSLFEGKAQKLVTTTERLKLPEIFSCDQVFYINSRGNIFTENESEN